MQLARNYRSSPAIVTAAMQAIAPATLVPGRKPPPVRAPGARACQADSASGAGRRFHEAADEHAEAAWIAAAIDQLLGGTSFHSLDSGRADGHGHGKLGLADIAVLYRTDAQAGPLGQALTRAGLPFQKGSHDLLERRTGVPEIMREMRLTADPTPGRRSPGSCAPRSAGRRGRPGQGRARAGRLAGRGRAGTGDGAAWTCGPRASCWRRSPAGAAPTWSASAPRSRSAPRPTRSTPGPMRSRC